jgi:RNA polymerase sigma-70 factor (ECF subfamily)
MEDCISQYGGLMWSIVRKYSRNQSDAEDLVKEIFTSLSKVASALAQKNETETTFIGMLAGRRDLDWPRKQGRIPDFELLSNDHNEMSNSSPLNATVINQDIVMKALENLLAGFQTLFRYHYV